MAYQGFKHREIFDPAMRLPDPDRAGAARRLKDMCLASDHAFRAYVSKWSSVDVLDRWDEYRPAALRLIADLRTGVAQEKAEARTLLRG